MPDVIVNESSMKINWDELGFRITPTRSMYINTCVSEQPWGEGKFVPYGDISMSPASGVLNYGQGIFEGLKAQYSRDNRLLLFRPADNAKRFAQGAVRCCMPPFPEDQFVKIVHDIVQHNRDYVPPYGKGSLYIRPCLWGTGAILGVAPAPEYTLLVYVSPVGNYYKGELTPIKLQVSEDYQRSAPKGMGQVKFIGNYAGSLLGIKAVKAQGFNGCIYLDAVHERFVEEVGTSNFFCVRDNVLYTPKLGSILPGITRASVIQLAKDTLNMKVVETDVDINAVLQADECFCTGTAAVITPIGMIQYQGRDVVYNDFQVGSRTRELYRLLTDIQAGDAKDPFNWVSTVE